MRFLLSMFAVLVFACDAGAQICQCSYTGVPKLEIISRDSLGVQAETHSEDPTISANGELVAFRSKSSVLAGQYAAQYQIYAKNLCTGALDLVTSGIGGALGNKQSFLPVASPNGRYVAFLSFATNLTTENTYGHKQAFVADLYTGQIRLISKSLAGEGGDHNVIYEPTWSPDSTKIAFVDHASDLVPGDTNSDPDLFIYDVATDSLVSPTVGLPEIDSGDWIAQPWFVDNVKIAFRSNDFEELGAGVGPSSAQIIIYDLIMQVGTVVSTSSSGDWASSTANFPTVSADGNMVAWISESNNLVTDPYADIYVHAYHKNLATGVTQLASTSTIYGTNKFDTKMAAISPDGQKVAMELYAKTILTSYSSPADIVIKDIGTGGLVRVTEPVSGSALGGGAELRAASWSGNSNHLVFMSKISNLTNDDTYGSRWDVFLYSLNALSCPAP